MRIAEAMSVKVEHVALKGDPRLSQCPHGTAAVFVAQTKTGPSQLALVDDQLVTSALAKHDGKKRSKGAAMLFNVTYADMLQLTHEAAQALGYSAPDFTSHSYRHGGALHLCMQGFTAETIAMRGRWKSFQSLQRHLNTGRGRLLSLQSSS